MRLWRVVGAAPLFATKTCQKDVFIQNSPPDHARVSLSQGPEGTECNEFAALATPGLAEAGLCLAFVSFARLQPTASRALRRG